MAQVGSGRPEYTDAPAVHGNSCKFEGLSRCVSPISSSVLPDFYVPMHDDHEGTEIRVAAAIRGSRIRDQIPAIVELRRLSTAWLVRPVPIATLSIPMKIPIRPDHQRHKVALFGAPVVGTGRCNERVGDGSRPHLGTGDGAIHRSIRQP